MISYLLFSLICEQYTRRLLRDPGPNMQLRISFTLAIVTASLAECLARRAHDSMFRITFLVERPNQGQQWPNLLKVLKRRIID